MTIDQLEMLEAIVKHGNYQVAADSLRKSQPSLSVGIKKLEEEFGIILFDRKEYRSQLTDQGKIFYRWALESLESFRNLNVIGKEMGQKKAEAFLEMAIDPLVQFSSLKTIFNLCLGTKSVTELKLRTELLESSKELVLGQHVDFAIGLLGEGHDELDARMFQKVQLIPVATTDVARDYKKYPQIIVNAHGSLGVQSKGFKCYVSDHSMKCKIIAAGLGWGRLARHEIQEDYPELVRIKDKLIQSHHFELYFMRNKNRPMGPVAKKIWNSII